MTASRAKATIRPAQNAVEVDAAMELRKRVFCDEQGVSLDSERDGRDGRDALHLVAETDGQILGTCRVIVAGKTATLSRMAIERNERGSGIGRALLRAAHLHARQEKARRVVLHAQMHALGFYEAEGYAPRGPIFMEEGIEHVAMEKRLSTKAPG